MKLKIIRDIAVLIFVMLLIWFVKFGDRALLDAEAEVESPASQHIR